MKLVGPYKPTLNRSPFGLNIGMPQTDFNMRGKNSEEKNSWKRHDRGRTNLTLHDFKTTVGILPRPTDSDALQNLKGFRSRISHTIKYSIHSMKEMVTSLPLSTRFDNF